MGVVFFLLLLLLPLPLAVHSEDLGELSANLSRLSGFSGLSGSFSFFGLFGSFGCCVSLVFRSANQMTVTNKTNPFSVRPTRQTK